MHPRNAIVIALGQPSAPLAHDDAMHALARDVEALLQGWDVRGATLESPASLAAAAEGQLQPLVYPIFMAHGFFLEQVLPKRLKRLIPGAEILPPLGDHPGIPDLVAGILLEAARAESYAVKETAVLLAAHGSEKFPASRVATERLVEDVADRTGFRRIVAGYLEEKPLIEESARGLGQAICLPVFALAASHVTIDVPDGLRKAAFAGVTLPPLGLHAKVPALIAAALQDHVSRQAA
jgi:sirohydrochlorin ferrochelatase